MKKIVPFILLSLLSLQSYADIDLTDNDKFIISSSFFTNNFSGIRVTDNALDISFKTSMGDDMFFGAGIRLLSNVLITATSASDYIDGKINLTKFVVGKDIIRDDGAILRSTFTHVNSAFSSTSHTGSGSTSLPDVTVSGGTIGVEYITSGSDIPFSFGVSKGMTGDLSDDETRIAIAFYYQFNDESIYKFGYSTSDGDSVFGITSYF
jgi:hypothetical protein